ncbi:MAG: alpha/beta hydrolase [Solobacterium sp.]|jgi:acetyl esterase/lipase|nr:alpha/beta hydrolase [Solobacterium sp.]MCH4266000.1 alpha/beta hydrolase [Solobacterium sp.]
MEDLRKYDKKLVQAIRDKQHVENIDGLDILMKPVPDDDRPHAMDPRVFEIASRKKKMFSSRAKGGWKLSNERYRPDKVTYDLTTVPVSCDERLIRIDDDHMIDVYIYRREDDHENTLPVMIYFHGGGFTAGDMKLYANQMKLIAELAHATVVFPEYRLAPECPYPGPVNDGFGTIQWVIQHADELHVDPQKLMVAGDSAGGALTNSCLVKDEQEMIKKVFELYPACDSRDYRTVREYTWSYEQYPALPEQDEIAKSRIDRIKNSVGQTEEDNLYLQGKTKYSDPMVSILCASDDVLKRLPPIIIADSEFDYLRIQDEAFAQRLKSLGKDVKNIRYCGCDHGFLDMLGTVVQAEEICHTIAEEITEM